MMLKYIVIEKTWQFGCSNTRGTEHIQRNRKHGSLDVKIHKSRKHDSQLLNSVKQKTWLFGCTNTEEQNVFRGTENVAVCMFKFK